MSFLYSLFGMVRTVYDFADKAKRTGQDKIYITFEERTAFDDFRLIREHTTVATLKAGDVTFRLNPVSKLEPNLHVPSMPQQNPTERPCLEDALEVAETLAEQGFVVQIGDKPLWVAKAYLESLSAKRA